MKYPIGIQNFSEIVDGGYVYLDKTKLLYDLVHNGKIYFLSRPRRFGKSLLISTLECYFQGKKELFKGLAIEQLEKEWKQYPVFHIDFNGKNFTQAGELEKTLQTFVETQELNYGRNPLANTLGDRFMAVLKAAHEKTGLGAVVLIDEYDKPLLDVLDTGLKTFDSEGNERTQSQAARNVTFFNLIALHDGNRYVASRQIAPYKERLKTLLDQLDDFMTTLDQSGRKVAVVMVPEHGAALTGDKMQMAGLRDIPSPSITQVPVEVALLGTKAPHEATRNVDTPSSFLAVSELVSRLVGKDVFGSETIDWDALLGDLPQTPSVSENQGSVVIEYQGKYHIKLGQGDWVPYPQ
jgi:hypothetical protein